MKASATGESPPATASVLERGCESRKCHTPVGGKQRQGSELHAGTLETASANDFGPLE